MVCGLQSSSHRRARHGCKAYDTKSHSHPCADLVQTRRDACHRGRNQALERGGEGAVESRPDVIARHVRDAQPAKGNDGPYSEDWHDHVQRSEAVREQGHTDAKRQACAIENDDQD